MTKSRCTKRALFTSALALILCVSMLAGSTFAWFTDSVTSSGNIIKSGTLDVTMEWFDGTKAVPTADSDDWTDASTGAIFNYSLWEPGYTQVRHIKIANEGSLALKYQLAIVANGVVSDLADVIDVYYADPAVQVANRGDLTAEKKLGTLTQVLAAMDTTASGSLKAGEMDTITIALKMQETAGNEYQGKEIGSDFSVVLVATQETYESDSFGDDYDTDAEYPTIITGGSVTQSVTPVDGKVPAGGVTMTGDSISAFVPAGAKMAAGANALTLSVTPMDYTTSDIAVANNEILTPVDVHISGLAADNTVPVVIDLGEVLPKYLNMGNYRLYHVENGANSVMTLVNDEAALTEHNRFTYDPLTGAVKVAMASFSEVALLANTTNIWQGETATKFAGGSGTSANPYLIANADQLALLNDRVSNQNETYGSAYYRLTADINLGSGANGHIFYPIGYHKLGEGVNAAGEETWYTYGGDFSGIFDGNGHIISGLYQRTWDMDGDYDKGYWNDAMGLFGCVNGGTVKNLVIDHFFSEGEFAPTGCITAYAAGNATFTNIAIVNSHPQTYNTGVAGIIGWDKGGDTEDTASNFTFNYITVDETTTVSALWGSWDVAAAGILGYLGEYSKATFNDCHVSATIDVYNDVCGNYQYYWYRYCGAYIGTVDRRLDNGKGALDLANVTANNCTVAFGDRHEYFYCEFEKNTQASYTEDYQFSRIDHADLVFVDTNDNGRVDENEKDSVTGCTHDHTDKEDKQAVYIPFRQLFGGYGWGVDGVDVDEYNKNLPENERIDISTVTTAVEKFEAADTRKESYHEYHSTLNNKITIGELFKAKEGADIRLNNVQVTVSPADEHSTVTGTYTRSKTNWAKGTLTLKGVGDAIITITDYAYCLPTTVKVTVTSEINYFISGDFEGDNPDLKYWQTAYIDKGRAELTTLDGNTVMALKDDKWEAYLQALSVETKSTYRLTFQVQGGPIKLLINDKNTDAGDGTFTITPSEVGWTTCEYTFTTASPCSAGYLLKFIKSANSGVTYIDNITLYKVTK